MIGPRFEVPGNWGDPLSELSVAGGGSTEDEEDILIKRGREWYASLTDVERAAIDQRVQEDLDRFQQPGVIQAVDRAFRRAY